jgi:hypothetical protein
MVALEGATEALAPAVEEHPLIGLADLENVTDLLGAPALQVPQGHDRPLGLRQSFQLPFDRLARLLLKDQVPPA